MTNNNDYLNENSAHPNPGNNENNRKNNPNSDKNNKKAKHEDNATKMQAIRQKKAKEKLKNRKFARIPADKLRYSLFDIEQKPSEKQLLNHTIESYGMLQPLSVCGPYSDGTYKIVDGARRFETFCEMPDTEKILMPCYIVESAVSDEELEILKLAANITQRESSKGMVFSYIQMYETRAANGLISESSVASLVAKDCNFTPRHIRDFQGVWNRGSQEIIDAVSMDVIPIKIANSIVTAFPDDKDRQNTEAALYASAKTNQEKKEAKARLDDIVCATKAGAKSVADAEAFARKALIKKLNRGAVNALSELLRESPDASAITPELIGLCRTIVEKYG